MLAAATADTNADSDCNRDAAVTDSNCNDDASRYTDCNKTPTSTPTATATATPTATPLRLQQRRPALRPRQRRGQLRPQDQGLRQGQSQHPGLGPEWKRGEGRSKKFGNGSRSPCPRRMGTRTTSKSRDRELGSFTDYSRLRVKLRRAGTPFGVQVRHGRFVLWRICSVRVRRGTDSLRRAVRSLFGFAPLVL